MIPASVVSFLVLGDAGSGKPAQFEVGAAMATWCASHACDFVALLGDNFYPVGVASRRDPQWQTSFEQPYAGLHIPFHPALGNHDYYGNQHAELAYHSDRWSMPSRYYSYVEGPAELFVLDTERWTRREQRWLEKGLAASQARWQIVYGHHPIRSSGKHGVSPKLESGLLPLLTSGGVDFYLAGHDHDAEVIDGTPVLVVCGTGGAKLREVTPAPDTTFAVSTHGFGWMEIGPDTARYVFVDSAGSVVFDRTWPHAP